MGKETNWTWIEGLAPVKTVYSFIHRKNCEFTGPAGASANVEQGISFLRSQHEETYKQLIAPVISHFLNNLVVENDKKSIQKSIGIFNAPSPPEISIADYLARIVKYTPCSAECYILVLIFIDRIAQNLRVRVNSHNVHRLLLAATLISAKILDDSTYNNRYYSHVGGVPIKELNSLECKFLGLLNYDLNIPLYTFELYRYELELQLIRQMFRDNPESIFSAEEMLKWEDNKAPVASNLTTDQSHSLLRSKRIRRSRSFNSPDESKDFSKRKSRSISLTILSLVSPSTVTTA